MFALFFIAILIIVAIGILVNEGFIEKLVDLRQSRKTFYYIVSCYTNNSYVHRVPRFCIKQYLGLS